MEIIKRRKLGEFKIYTKEEADAEGIKYVYWKEAQVGDMALTDDGYVAVCRTRDDWKVGLPFGFFPFKLGCKWEDRRGRRDTWYTISIKSFGERKLKKSWVKAMIKDYVKLRSVGKEDKKIWVILGERYFSRDKLPHITCRILFRNKHIKKAVEVEFEKEMDRLGISDEWLIRKLQKAVEIAETNEDADVMLKAVKIVTDWKGHGKKVQTTQQEIGMVSREFLEGKLHREELLLGSTLDEN